MELMAVANLASALKYLCPLSAYPIHRLVTTSGRRSEENTHLRKRMFCHIMKHFKG